MRFPALLAGALLAVGLTACVPTRQPTAPPTPTTTWGPVQHDVAPVAKHFPELGAPVSTSWTKGSFGIASTARIDLPSPPSTRLDAIVELQPATADSLRARFANATPPSAGTTPAPEFPDVAPALRSALPDGQYLHNDDTLGTKYGWSGTVYLHRDRPVAVLSMSLPWATGFSG
ncbi:MAG: hypothetical protein QM634_09390 [Gordonia sp. (in: high G+C Gram-positive bacteria)]